MSELVYAKQDSIRFGMRIFRMDNAQTLDVPYILNEILRHNIDVAIIRIPTIELTHLDRLEKTAIPFIIADSLVYYEAELSKIPYKELQNKDLTFEIAGLDDHTVLNEIVAECFGNYMNHYRTNSYFDKKAVTEGYQDWVRSYAEGNPKRICWLVKQNGKVIGFTNFNFEESGVSKGILYGVTKEARGKGVFRDMIRYAINFSKDRGCERINATMQLENIPVQRVWHEEGLNMHHAISTIHINSLLTKSVFDPFTEKVKISRDQMKSQKVTNRHTLEKINYFFDFKQNMETRNHRFINLKPIQPEVEYDFYFSYPAASKGMLRVMDDKKETYILVYFDIKHGLA
ncbi:MAG: GNAT family N-acetyltransferase [Cytophagales bacterium]|nr:GNAT family N-acetyltransferase [Cytophagales bacterium]MDW8383665.1 GNAT family N-acetyltransferase [Flammeovirgaceae bacterium]